MTKRRAAMLWGALLAALTAARDAPAADAAERMARLGVIGYGVRSPAGSTAKILKELERLGYVEGRNLVVEFRSIESASDFAAIKVDVLVALTNPAIVAAQRITRTTPTVGWGFHGAVELGLVSSLRHPGGNLTGVESLAVDLDAKRMELLKQIVPDLARVAVLYNADDQGSAVHLKSTRAAGQSLGVGISTLEVRRPEDFVPVLAANGVQPPAGLMTYSSLLTFAHWKPVNDFALANRVPTLCEFRELALAGCLLSYGTTTVEMSERAAGQIAKILKGAAPGDLPVEQVTRFELVVNLKTAKAIGVTIPQAVLLRADEVIQ